MGQSPLAWTTGKTGELERVPGAWEAQARWPGLGKENEAPRRGAVTP